jgi:RNA polymerase sigma-70 factor (ECF subfamily)
MSTVTVFKVIGTPNTQELEQVFREHYQLVYRTAYSVTGNVQDAEDVLQTIFAGLLRRELPPDIRKNPRAYFYRAAFNLSLNRVRDRKRHVSSGDVETLEDVAHHSDSDVNEELDKRLYEAIAELHPTAAQIVILRYVHNHTLADIAKLLGTSRSTVAVSLFRSRARLKKLIQHSLEKRS